MIVGRLWVSAWLLSSTVAAAQDTTAGRDTLIPVAPPPARAPLPSFDRFPVGEKLEFEGRLGPIRLGRAFMEVVGDDLVRGVPARHFQFRMRVNMAGVYRNNDQFDSWVGLHDFVSRRFVQRYNSTGQEGLNHYEIYPDSGHYTRQDVDTTLAAAPNPLDDTAFFYFVRTLDLVPGDTLRFENYFRPDRNPVTIAVLERDTIDIPAGRFEAVVIHPIINGGGIFRESSDARMWITDDSRRLIVQMQSKFGFGRVTLRLREMQGVRGAAPENVPR
jgi:hypothetical protein